jgi:hypothetical protein
MFRRSRFFGAIELTQQSETIAAMLKVAEGMSTCGSQTDKKKSAQALVAKTLFAMMNPKKSKSALVENYFTRSANEVIRTLEVADKMVKKAQTENLKRTYSQRGDNSPPSKEPGAEGVPDKYPDPSTYSSYSDCVDDLTSNYHVDSGVAANFCKSVNPDENQSGPKTAVRKVNHGFGGGSSVIKTTIPQRGTVKQASTEIPVWAKLMTGITHSENLDMGTATNVRSASYDNPIYNQTIADIIYSNREARYSNNNTKAIKSAASSKIPAWARALNLDSVE